MAGSNKNFVYTTSKGQTFVVTRDESNTEAVNGNSYGYVGSPEIVYGLPKNVKPREVYYTNEETRQTVRVTILNPAVTPPLTIYTDFKKGLEKGEVIKAYKIEDTGQIDGDQP